MGLQRFDHMVLALINTRDVLKVMLPVRLLFLFILVGVTVFGCAGPYQYPYTVDYPGEYLHPIATRPVTDGRERFREIFCGLLAKDPGYRNEAGQCEDFLLRLSDEVPLNRNPEPVPEADTRYRILVVFSTSVLKVFPFRLKPRLKPFATAVSVLSNSFSTDALAATEMRHISPSSLAI